MRSHHSEQRLAPSLAIPENTEVEHPRIGGDDQVPTAIT